MRTEIYRIYVTDSLKLSAENKYLTTRYAEMLHPKPEEERTSEDIIKRIKNKFDEGV